MHADWNTAPSKHIRSFQVEFSPVLRWVNNILKRRGYSGLQDTKEVLEAMSDGVLLKVVVEGAIGASNHSVDSPCLLPRSRQERYANVQQCFELLQQGGVNLMSCSIDDVCDQNERPTLNMLFSLYQLCRLKRLSKKQIPINVVDRLSKKINSQELIDLHQPANEDDKINNIQPVNCEESNDIDEIGNDHSTSTSTSKVSFEEAASATNVNDLLALLDEVQSDLEDIDIEDSTSANNSSASKSNDGDSTSGANKRTHPGASPGNVKFSSAPRPGVTSPRRINNHVNDSPDPAPPISPIPNKRELIKKELIDTEITYNQVLEEMVKYYIDPICANCNNVNINSSATASMKKASEQLMSTHKYLLRDLTEKNKELGETFLFYAPAFNQYSAYCDAYYSFVKVLRLAKHNTKLEELLRECQEKSVRSKVEMTSLLIAPVQRLPRYILLLEDYKKNSVGMDNSKIEKALHVLKDILTSVDESLNQTQRMHKVMSIQLKIGGEYEDLVKPGRIYVCEGPAKVWERGRKKYRLAPADSLVPVMLFLFCDQLVLAKIKDRNKYVHYMTIPLTTSSIRVKYTSMIGEGETLNSGVLHAFHLVSKAETITFSCSSEEDRLLWISNLSKVIDDNRKMLRNTKLFFLGSERCSIIIVDSIKIGKKLDDVSYRMKVSMKDKNYYIDRSASDFIQFRRILKKKFRDQSFTKIKDRNISSTEDINSGRLILFERFITEITNKDEIQRSRDFLLFVSPSKEYQPSLSYNSPTTNTLSVGNANAPTNAPLSTSPPLKKSTNLLVISNMSNVSNLLSSKLGAKIGSDETTQEPNTDQQPYDISIKLVPNNEDEKTSAVALSTSPTLANIINDIDNIINSNFKTDSTASDLHPENNEKPDASEESKPSGLKNSPEDNNNQEQKGKRVKEDITNSPQSRSHTISCHKLSEHKKNNTFTSKDQKEFESRMKKSNHLLDKDIDQYGTMRAVIGLGNESPMWVNADTQLSPRRKLEDKKEREGTIGRNRVKSNASEKIERNRSNSAPEQPKSDESAGNIKQDDGSNNEERKSNTWRKHMMHALTHSLRGETRNVVGFENKTQTETVQSEKDNESETSKPDVDEMKIHLKYKSMKRSLVDSYGLEAEMTPEEADTLKRKSKQFSVKIKLSGGLSASTPNTPLVQRNISQIPRLDLECVVSGKYELEANTSGGEQNRPPTPPTPTRPAPPPPQSQSYSKTDLLSPRHRENRSYTAKDQIVTNNEGTQSSDNDYNEDDKNSGLKRRPAPTRPPAKNTPLAGPDSGANSTISNNQSIANTNSAEATTSSKVAVQNRTDEKTQPNSAEDIANRLTSPRRVAPIRPKVVPGPAASADITPSNTNGAVSSKPLASASVDEEIKNILSDANSETTNLPKLGNTPSTSPPATSPPLSPTQLTLSPSNSPSQEPVNRIVSPRRAAPARGTNATTTTIPPLNLDANSTNAPTLPTLKTNNDETANKVTSPRRVAPSRGAANASANATIKTMPTSSADKSSPVTAIPTLSPIVSSTNPANQSKEDETIGKAVSPRRAAPSRPSNATTNDSKPVHSSKDDTKNDCLMSPQRKRAQEGQHTLNTDANTKNNTTNNVTVIPIVQKREELFAAVKSGDLITIKTLAHDKFVLNARDVNGWTALHLALSNPATLLIGEELTNIEGIEANIMNIDGCTPLHYAVRSTKGDSMIVSACRLRLIRNLLKLNCNINEPNTLGQSPLHLACLHRDINLVKLLVDQKADVAYVNGKSNQTLLHCACRGGHKAVIEKVVQLLKEKGDFDAIKNIPPTPIEILSEIGKPELISLI